MWTGRGRKAPINTPAHVRRRGKSKGVRRFMLKGDRREQKRARAVAKTRRKSNIKTIWLLIRARQKRQEGKHGI